MPETTPLIKAALNLRVGAGFDVYPNSGIICCMDSSDEGVCFIDILHDSKIRDVSGRVRINGEEIPDAYLSLDTNKNLLEYNTPEEPWESLDIRKLYIEINIYGEVNPE